MSDMYERKIVSYILLAEQTPELLQITVNQHIHKGWEPYYGTIINVGTWHFCQAMVKYDFVPAERI